MGEPGARAESDRSHALSLGVHHKADSDHCNRYARRGRPPRPRWARESLLGIHSHSCIGWRRCSDHSGTGRARRWAPFSFRNVSGGGGSSSARGRWDFARLRRNRVSAWHPLWVQQYRLCGARPHCVARDRPGHQCGDHPASAWATRITWQFLRYRSAPASASCSPLRWTR